MKRPIVDLKQLRSRSARVLSLRRKLERPRQQHWTTRFGASGGPKPPSPPVP